MKHQIGRFRPKKVSLTTISNHVLLDTNLDMATKSLYALINYFLSIPNFTLYKGHVQHHTKLGDKAFNRMWKLFKDKGYLIQHKLKDEKGIFYYEYELLDQPLPQEAPLDNAPLAKSPSTEQAPINNTLINKPLINKIIIKQQEQEEDGEEARQEKTLKPLEATPVVSRLHH